MGLTTLFLGTPEVAVPSLQALLASAHGVAAAVTAPDRPKGRGMAVQAPPVKEAALAAGLEVLQPASLRPPEVQEALAAYGADLFVVCAYGLILPAVVLGIPRRGCVNVHFSLLPAYRGAAPVARAILDGASETGVTIMQVEPALDSGPVLAAAVEPIGADDDTGRVETRLAVTGAALLVEVLDRLAAGSVEAQPQDATRATYAAKLSPEEARLDWSAGADRIARQVRAFSPRPGAWTTRDGRRLKIWRATAIADGRVGGAIGGAMMGPGQLFEGPEGALMAVAGSGALVLDEVQPEGGRRMPGAAFRRGLRTLGRLE
ncbi:MAG TPA: methionyl-tRNA formyltransferase [Actinomycetota bacterium]|nr:methionyl-tRNA formyltransferase [Actinomycetota bacterium]